MRPWNRRAVRVAALAAAVVGAGVLRADHVNPSTTFDAPQMIAAGQDPVAVVTADFDGDGDTDVAFADADGSVVRIQRNDGTGASFVENDVTLGGTAIVDMAIGNLDAGTTPDFAALRDAGFVVGKNTGVSGGSLTFAVSGAVALDPAATGRKIAVADYNHDGFGDVIVAGDWSDMDTPDGGFVAVYFGTGDAATFGLAPDGLAILNDPVKALAAGDLDANAFPEVLTGDDATQSVTIFINPANGNVDLSFGARAYATAALYPRSIAIGEVTGDGHVDAVVAGSGDYTIGQNRTAFTILRNNGTSPLYLAYETQIIHSFPDGADQGRLPAGVAIADVDDTDGPEIVATQPLEAKVAVFHFADVMGTFVPGAIRRFDCGGLPYLVAAGDFDGDGETDLVTLNGATNQHAILHNAAFGGGGGGPEEDPEGDPLPAATNLSIKVGSKAPKNNAVQSGKKVKFSCTQTANVRGMRVRLQSTTTPDEEATWEDLVGGAMVRGKGKATTTFGATLSYLPSGRRYFRTVTSAHGYPDGIAELPGGTATPPSPADGYIGPYDIAPAGSVITLETVYGSVGLSGFSALAMPPESVRTFVGDTLAFRLRVTNDGTQPTGEALVSTQTPFNTDFRFANPSSNLQSTQLATNHKLVWTVPDIAPGESKDFYYTVDVTSRGNPNGVDMNAAANISIAGTKVKQVNVPATGTKIFIPFVSPLTLTVNAVTAAPVAGETMEYELVAKNGGAVLIDNCVAWDRLPDGTSYDVAFVSDASGDPVTTTDTWGDGRPNPWFDRATRKVYWVLGRLSGGEEKRMRLRVRVQNDVRPSSVLVNGAYLVQGCRPADGGRCSVLDLSTLQAQSGEPADVTTRTSATPAAGVPDLRFSQFAVVPGSDGQVDIAGFGAVAVPAPGGEVKHHLVIENFGTAAARGVRVSGNLPQDTEFVPGSVLVTPTRPAGAPFVPASTISSGGTLDIDVGDMGANTALTVEYRMTVRASASPNTYISARNWAVTTDSLSRIHFASPEVLPLYLGASFVPQWTAIRDTTEVEVGDQVNWTFVLYNAGNAPGANCKFTMTIPKGTTIPDEVVSSGPPPEYRKFVRRVDNAGNEVQRFEVPANAKSFTIDLGTVPKGLAGGVRVTFEYEKGQKGATSLQSNVSFTGNPPGAKDVPAGESRGVVAVPVASPGQTKLVVWQMANVAAVGGYFFDYTIVIGNVGAEDARGVECTMRAPEGTTRAALFDSPAFDGGAKLAGTDGVTWKLGTIPANRAVYRKFRVNVPRDGVPSSLVQDTVSVSFGNGVVYLPDPLRSFVLFEGREFRGYRWAATESVLRGLGMQIDGDIGDALNGVVSTTYPQSLVIVSPSGCVQLCDGQYVAPLGGGYALAIGRGLAVQPSLPSDPWRFVDVLGDDNGVMYIGPGDQATVSGLPGQPTLTANQVLDGGQTLVGAGCANMFAGVTGTLISKRGTTQIPTGAASNFPVPPFIDAGNLLRVGGGNIVAAGGGNIVAAGGGNIVAGGGGNIVAGGGGNIVAGGGGNIVAAGGGNIVAAGGGNIVAGGGGNIVAAGGGNIVAGGGGNVVATDGAGLIGQDGAGLIGQDGAGKRAKSAGSAAEETPSKSR